MEANIKRSVLGEGLFRLLVGIFVLIGIFGIASSTSILGQDLGVYQSALESGMYENRHLGQSYIYPPHGMLLVEPFFGWPQAFARMSTAIFAVAMGIVLGPLGAFLSLFYLPMYESSFLGQVNCLVVLGLALMLRGNAVLGGLGLSMIGATKIIPALAGIFAIREWKLGWRMVGYAIWFTFILVMLASMRYGYERFLEYPGVFLGLLDEQSAAIQNVSALRVLGEYAYPLRIIATAGWTLVFVFGTRESVFASTLILLTILPNVLWYHHLSWLMPAFLVINPIVGMICLIIVQTGLMGLVHVVNTAAIYGILLSTKGAKHGGCVVAR